MTGGEAVERFDCFGSRCSVLVTGAGAEQAAARAREKMLDWHERFSRFLPESELSRLNADPRRTVPVGPLMESLARAVGEAGALTGGLVDATLVREVRAAGYGGDITEPLGLRAALALAPERAPAHGRTDGDWSRIRVGSGAVTRPPGVQIDSGGLAKGLLADVLAGELSAQRSFAVDCGGDLRVGGSGGLPRQVHVQSPFDESILHTFELITGGVATSGIGRRSWRDDRGRAAHHLLDPSTGEPAFTGVVQATALAPTGLLAEIRAKAALLGGPALAARWLPDGGVLVFDDGSRRVVQPLPSVSLSELSVFARKRVTVAAQDR